MKRLQWLFVIAVLAICAPIVMLLFSTNETEPRGLLESAVQRATGPEPDRETAIEELSYALRLAENSGDRDLLSDILQARAQVYKEMGVLSPARADLERVLDYRPRNVIVRLELVEFDRAAGKLDEALAMVDAMVAEDRELRPAWAKRAEILAERAESRRAEAEAIVIGALTEADEPQALAALDAAVGLHPRDPRRVSLVHEVRSRFQPTDADAERACLQAIEAASEANAEAIVSLSRSLAGSFPRHVALQFIERLERSGDPDAAIDFGLAALAHERVAAYPPFVEALARTLLAAGRGERSAQIFDDALVRRENQPPRVHNAPAAFWLQACRSFYRSEQWSRLLFAVKELTNTAGTRREAQPLRVAATFYNGVGHYREARRLEEEARRRAAAEAGQQARELLSDARRRYEFALRPLEVFTRTLDVEVEENGLATVWRALAGTQRALGRPGAERAALIGATRVDPSGSADDWERLAELALQLDPEAREVPESALLHAMRLDPQRIKDLMPRWRAIGEARHRADGTEVELLLAELRRQGRDVPLVESGPFELFRLAEMHARDGEPLAVLACGRRLRNDYPGFVPLLNLEIAAAIESAQYTLAGTLLLERLRLVGPDPHTLATIAQLPPDALTPAQRAELLLFDPERTGRLLFARDLREHGRSAAALRGLDEVDLGMLGDDAALLVAELSLDVRQEGRALRELEEVPDDAEAAGRAVELGLKAALRMGNPAHLAEVVARIEVVEHIETGPLLTIVDELLVAGRVPQGQRILEGIDRVPRLRGGDVTLRLAIAALLEARYADAYEALERSRAYLTDGSPELGQLILSVEQGDWANLSRRVRALTASTPPRTTLQSALLAAFDERLADARQIAYDAQRLSPEEPLWPVVKHALRVLADERELRAEGIPEAIFAETERALGGEAREPRPFLVRVLAMDDPVWQLWVAADAARVRPPQPGSMWPVYLATRVLAQSVESTRAERRCRELNVSWPAFAAAWDLHEQLKLRRLENVNHIELVRLRNERRRALGLREEGRAEALLARAWDLEAQERNGPALAAAREAVNQDPRLAPAQAKLGDLALAAGKTSEAVEAYSRALVGLDDETARALIASYITALEQAEREGLLLDSALRSELLDLEGRFLDDPLPPLSLARSELRRSDVGPSVGVALAYAHLDRFRTRNPTASLDSLRANSARAWFSFLLTLDAARAEALVREELDRSPASIDLWRMLGEARAARGDLEGAVTLYETLQRAVPDAGTARSLADLRSRTGGDPRRVESQIDEVVRLEGLEAPDVDLLFLLARALVRGNKVERNRGIEILSGLWVRRAGANGRYGPADIGQLYGTALVQRADPRDRKLSYDLLQEVAGLIEHPMRRSLVEALANLGAQIPAQDRVTGSGANVIQR